MKTSSQLLIKPLVYGLVTCIIALLIREALLTEEIRYTSNWTSILFLLILSLGAFVNIKKLHNPSTGIRQLFAYSSLFAAAAGITVGFFYYVDVTMLDTTQLQTTLDNTHKSWAVRGYSTDAIAGQIEQTELFLNPLRWSLILTLFYFTATVGLSFVIGCIIHKGIVPGTSPG